MITELGEEKAKRKEETELLARKLAEKVKALETASQKVIDANNEVDVVRRKNQGRVRELSKELAAMKKKLDSQEVGLNGGGGGGGGGGGAPVGRGDSPGQLSLSSRCSSSSSLMDSQQEEGRAAQEGPQVQTVPLADTQTLLVEKIVKLQKNCARRQVRTVGHFIKDLFRLLIGKDRLIRGAHLSTNG